MLEAGRLAEAEIAIIDRGLAASRTALLANDPVAVLNALEDAFEDNSSPAVAIDCDEDRVTVIVIVASALPDTRPTLSERGKLVNKSWSAADSAAFQVTVMASAILATVKESWAVAPSLNAVTIVALTETEQFGIEGLTATEVLYRGTFTRDRYAQLAWAHIDVVDEIERADEVDLVRKGRSQAVQPLRLDKHPDLRDLINQMEQAWTDEPESDRETPQSTNGHASQPGLPSEG